MSFSVRLEKEMPRTFGLVDSKVQEAEYFLNRIINADMFFFGVQCDAVAFTAAARSITFAMQSSLKGIPEFNSWYEEKQKELRADPLARFFNDFRRISQHIGENVVVGGSVDRENGVLFYFGSLPDLPNVPDLDVASACKQYFKNTLKLVYECYITFPTLINGKWYFTKEHFASLDKTIEDAVEELGFPRNWARVPGLDEDAQWFCLRRQADGCNIQEQFMNWLDKRVPYPDDESTEVEDLSSPS
ncbi:MAG: hypothetical protein EAZ61_02205 [Oscillatoriales cyanobacterium]|nr:MAG: hypothetical protein EAZ61_02205 [Oscillatoriales cyanobacterium]